MVITWLFQNFTLSYFGKKPKIILTLFRSGGYKYCTSWFFHSLEQLLFYEIFFSDVKSKIIQSVQLLHGKIKAGAKIIPTRRFSQSNRIGIIEVAPGGNYLLYLGGISLVMKPNQTYKCCIENVCYSLVCANTWFCQWSQGDFRCPRWGSTLNIFNWLLVHLKQNKLLNKIEVENTKEKITEKPQKTET